MGNPHDITVTMKNKPIQKLKPHGQPPKVFTISIDDGYVEYSYDMRLSKDTSILAVERKIRRALRCRKAVGRMRTPPVLMGS
jgi:hypothetical protein